MKKLTAVLLAAALLAPAALFAANFEGKVRFKITTGKNAQDLDYSIKDGLARLDLQTNETSAAVIINPTRQEVTILMAEQKVYMVQPIAGKAAAAKNADAPDVSFEKTTVTEKILGYDCTKYVAKTKDSTSEIWATEQLGAFIGMGPGMDGGGMAEMFGGGRKTAAPGAQPWETALAQKDFFPLRVVSQTAKNKETMRMEAAAVEKKSLPATDFAPPAGWQKFDMGAMMRGLMPGGR